MSGVPFLLQAFDDAWGHKWESLTVVLRGVTGEEADWSHSSYASEKPASGGPKPGSILWQIDHLAGCKSDYTETLLKFKGREVPQSVSNPNASLETSLKYLNEIHALQREVIASFGESDLNRMVTGEMSLSEFLSMCIRHDIWHAGQIAVLRRLYSKRNS